MQKKYVIYGYVLLSLIQLDGKYEHKKGRIDYTSDSAYTSSLGKSFKRSGKKRNLVKESHHNNSTNYSDYASEDVTNHPSENTLHVHNIQTISFDEFEKEFGEELTARDQEELVHLEKEEHEKKLSRENDFNHNGGDTSLEQDENFSTIIHDINKSGSAVEELQDDDASIILSRNSSHRAMTQENRVHLSHQYNTSSSMTLTVPQEIALLEKLPGESFKIFSANVHLFPPIIHKFGSSYNETIQSDDPNADIKRTLFASPARAVQMGKVLQESNQEFDVIALQEAWDNNSRDAFYNEIKSRYPHKVEDRYQSLLAYAKLDVILGSGLVLYSKHSFEPLVNRDGTIKDFFLETFVEYRGDECFAHKGFLIGKIIKDETPVYVVTTHLQAGASDVDKKYFAGASRLSTRQVAHAQLKQIKEGLAYLIMHDFYKDHLEAIIRSSKIDTNGVKGFFHKYMWNVGAGVVSFVKNKLTGEKDAWTIAEKEEAAVRKGIQDFINQHPEMWSKAYIFLCGDFNINSTDEDYDDILEVFGTQSQTIMQADKSGSTSYDDLGKGTLKDRYRIDHIFSLGKMPTTKDGNLLAGGSYISSLFDHTHTDHITLEAIFKLRS